MLQEGEFVIGEPLFVSPKVAEGENFQDFVYVVDFESVETEEYYYFIYQKSLDQSCLIPEENLDALFEGQSTVDDI